MGRYSDPCQATHFHKGENDIDVLIDFSRRGMNSTLIVTFNGAVPYMKAEVQLFASKVSEAYGPVKLQNPEEQKVRAELLDKALNDAFIALADKNRKTNGRVEGAPLHAQPGWDDFELMQIAVEAMSRTITEPVRQRAAKGANGGGILQRIGAAFRGR